MKRQSIYQEITDRVIGMLEAGHTPPWMMPWRAEYPEPISGPTGKAYRGINRVVLGLEAQFRGFKGDARWFTFNQAKAQAAREAIRAGVDLEERTSAKGGTYWVHRDTGRAFLGGVRKGEIGTRVVWQSKITIKGKGKGETADPSEAGDDGEGGRSVWCVRHYTVFHVSQCDGIALRSVETPGSTVDPIQHAEDLAQAYLAQQGIKVSVGGSRACYSPAEDRIRMPERDAFEDAPRYYSTLFHEIGHSTGHASRLARKGVTDPVMFGSHTYAQEELVAEFAATFIMGGLGIARPDVEEQSAAYLKSWAAKIRDDPKVLPIAAAQAQKAADLVFAALGEVEGEESEEGEGETAAA